VLTAGSEDVVFDPDDAQIAYVVAVRGPCVTKTTDGGVTYHALARVMSALGEVAETQGCDSVSIDFGDPDRAFMLAGAHERKSVYRSEDAGQSWTDIAPTIPDEAGFTSMVTVLDRSTYLVGTYAGTASGIYRTVDAGDSWTQVYEGEIDSRPLRLDSGDMYWMTRSFREGILKSTDDGQSWAKVPGSEIVSWTEEGLITLPDGRFVAPGDKNRMVSSDFGSTWSLIGQEMPFAPRGVVYSRDRAAFYLWHFDCESGVVDQPVRDGAIVRLPFDYQTNE
jgi:photosystem II stability/assembly factor-like uncharacterized protein